MKPKVLVSACLLGEPVRYDGTAKPINAPQLQQWQAQRCIVPFCPEVAGGLGVPRPRAEIEPGADADEVLAGKAKVRTIDGGDCTDAFISGAEAALALCLRKKIALAVLKEKSPSCGVRCVADGTFCGRVRAGMGITARLLQRHGIAVFSEQELQLAFEDWRRRS